MNRSVSLFVGEEIADLADARGVSVEDLVGEAVQRYVGLEAEAVRSEAVRLAQRHASLLRRLGQ